MLFFYFVCVLLLANDQAVTVSQFYIYMPFLTQKLLLPHQVSMSDIYADKVLQNTVSAFDNSDLTTFWSQKIC